jgi:hypothetical protein
MSAGNRWVVLVGMVEGNPYEIFAMRQSSLHLPAHVKNGKLVKELDPTASKFTLGTVKPGVYFVTITAGNKQEVIKLIKE